MFGKSLIKNCTRNQVVQKKNDFSTQNTLNQMFSVFAKFMEILLLN